MKYTNYILHDENFQRLLDALIDMGYQVIAPTHLEGLVQYGPICKANELPIGWTDEQRAGSYRTHKRHDQAKFGYNLGVQSWKKYLLPPKQKLWSASKSKNGTITFSVPHEGRNKQAFLGVRPCELQGILLQDQVFQQREYKDVDYQNRRAQTLIIAVNCTQSSAVCFCTSMGTGPQATQDFDISLTEVVDKNSHYFVVHCASDIGEKMCQQIGLDIAHKDQLAAESSLLQQNAQQIGDRLPQQGIKALLYENHESPVWDEVAERCLSCANCTLSCPTCFCTTVQDATDLTEEHSERWRQWDSCFNQDFTYLHGGHVRTSVRARYRQWITHKLASWHDQFGASGCTGCGHCITWCPAGIDIREEVGKLRRNQEK